jgi:hypothetical protein
MAGFSLSLEARPYAERFLKNLDTGNVPQAYAMLSQEVRATYTSANLAQAAAQRQTKGGIRRTFVRTWAARVPPSRVSTVGRPTAFKPANVTVCFIETPTVNFKSVSYTAVTVSGRADIASLRIENFQTTSEPAAVCR